MHGMFSRRRLLLGTAIGGGSMAALAFGGPARAFTTESIEPGSALGVAYADRCVPDAEHAQIRASLEGRLALQSAAPGTTVTASQVCPICGCPIYVTRKVD